MNVEERFKLLKRNTQEIVKEEELKKILKKKQPCAYIGYAPTGRLHIGYLIPLVKVADFLKAGFKFKLLIADLHAYLDDMKTSWNLLDHRAKYYEEAIKAAINALGADTKNLEFVTGSSFQLGKQYFLDTLQLVGQVTVNRSKRAASEVVRFKQDPKLGGFIYPLMQILDPLYLKADVSFGGIDQRGIYMLGREMLPDMKGQTLTCLFTPLLPGLQGIKMSASDTKSKIDLLDSKQDVEKKVNSAFCPIGEVKDNGILAFLEYVVIPIKQDKGEKFTIKRPTKFGGDVVYENYKDLEKDYKNKDLHPQDLKKALAQELNLLLEPIRKHFKNKQDLLKKAYP